MKKIFSVIGRFIEEQGISLFVTLLTGGVIVLITMISWFWPNVYTIISDNHVFEAIVLVLLIEVVILLAQRDRVESKFEIFEQDVAAQTRILELIEQKPFDKVTILASGLASRRLIVAPLIKKGIQVEVLVQDPETSLDKQDIQRLKEAIDWIRIDVGEEYLEKLNLRYHVNIASLRAIVLYESHSKIRHVFLGWYIYTQQNTAVRGSQHPTIYITTRSSQGGLLIIGLLTK